jgi:hypothetical protein
MGGIQMPQPIRNWHFEPAPAPQEAGDSGSRNDGQTRRLLISVDLLGDEAVVRAINAALAPDGMSIATPNRAGSVISPSVSTEGNDIPGNSSTEVIRLLLDLGPAVLETAGPRPGGS